MKTALRGFLCARTLAACLYVQAQEKEILSLTGAAAIEELEEEEYERLCALLAAPIPINAASLSRLQSCGLFTRFQAISLADYRSRSGEILSLSELALIDGFSRETAEALAPFVSFRPTGKAGRPPRSRSLRICRCRIEHGPQAYARPDPLSLSQTAPLPAGWPAVP